MALSFNGLQPVTFGGKECMPTKPDAELQLRLQNIKDFNDEADDVLASAFPNDYDYVRDFLRSNMTLLEKQELQVYLLGGETGLRDMEKLMTSGANAQNG